MISVSHLIYLSSGPGMQNPDHDSKSAQDSKVVALARGSSSSTMSFTGQVFFWCDDWIGF